MNFRKNFATVHRSILNLRTLSRLMIFVLTVAALLAQMPAGVAYAADDYGDQNPTVVKKIVTPQGSLILSVDKGCGATYYAGDSISIDVSVPESGWMTMWGNTNGNWNKLAGPQWVTPQTGYNLSGAIHPPLGSELIYVKLDGQSGQQYQTSCNYTSMWNTPQPPQQPELQCSIYMPHSVNYGDYFEIKVGVSNVGNAKAHNVSLYGKATPSGYFQIHSCSPNCNGTTTHVGDIHAGNTKWVSYWVSAPDNKAGDFDFEFSASGKNGLQAYCGTNTLSVLGGQFFILPESGK